MADVTHIRGPGGAMRKVPREFTDAELLADVRLAQNRERYARHIERQDQHAQRMRARLTRWVRNIILAIRSPL